MNTFSVVLLSLIVFFILHRILMKWQINRSVDHLIKNAKPLDDFPELVKNNEILQLRLEELKQKQYSNEFDLLYDLTILHVQNMIGGESGYSFDKSKFSVKRFDNSNVGTRVIVFHFGGRQKVYEIRFTQSNGNFLDADNYTVKFKKLDLFCNDLDRFQKD